MFIHLDKPLKGALTIGILPNLSLSFNTIEYLKKSCYKVAPIDTNAFNPNNMSKDAPFETKTVVLIDI